MAIPSHFPTFSSLSPPKLIHFHISSLNVQRYHFHLHPHHRRRHLLPAISASIKKFRASSRKVRSNADLCNDIREFMSVVGLPDGHVPSLKELSQHGRQDLANIVRRRGYKLIRELLATSINTEINASDEEKGLTGEQDKASVKEEESTEGQDENLKDSAEDISLSSEAPVMGENFSSTYIDSNSNSSYENAIANEGATKSLLEKVAMFIQNGELETTEDIGLDTLKENVTEVDKGIGESPIPAEHFSSVSDEESDQVLYRTDAAEESSESIPSSSQLVGPSTFDNGHVRKNYSSTDQVVSLSDKELDVEAGTTENQIEVNRLKFMLHQKELELSHLKQQIEKEKQALSNLQSKAETEISNAQKLILDKDAELQAAEESLSGLKEVLIEYQGVAQTVEVAGSFNGWHHPVKLDPQPSSSFTDPVGLRNTRLWKSMLWLYPGIYEIKFIVDGQWTIDPERESIIKGSIHNNILRVGK